LPSVGHRISVVSQNDGMSKQKSKAQKQNGDPRPCHDCVPQGELAVGNFVGYLLAVGNSVG